MEKSKIKNSDGGQAGQAVLITILFFLLTSSALLLAFSSIALRETNSSRRDLRSKQSYFLSEAGMEDILWRIRSGKQYDLNEAVSLDGRTAVVSVTSSGKDRTVESSGDIASAIRRLRIIVQSGVGIAFPYGLQAGAGGLFMENSSRLIGSVYSAGNITGNNTPEITGDAFAAAGSIIDDIYNIGGQARAHAITESAIAGSATSTTSITDSTISTNAYADSVSGSDISGMLFYCTSQSGNSIGLPPAVQSCPPPNDLPVIPFPLTDQQISDWEAAAEAGGIHTSPCPYVLSDGITTLGPRKINCDFTVQNDAIVIVRGPIWVAGNVNIQNSTRLELDPAYGATSEVLIADNPSNRTTSSKITVQNSAQVLGSGTSGSYLMLISQNNSAEIGGNEIAITPKNFTDASIYYAHHGKILIENNTSLKEVTAYAIHMKNSAQLTYELGLANANFTAGPTGGWSITTWNEVK